MQTKQISKIAKVGAYIWSHKITTIIFLVIVFGVGYYAYGKITSTTGDTRYITSKVEKGTIVASVTGTGQVSVSQQIDLKPRASGNINVSGNITKINVKAGDKVSQGQILFTLDDRDARKAVRDAEANLESANLDLETARASIGNTDENQQTNIHNAYRALLNSSITAISSISTSDVTPPVITGTYIKDKEGAITITVYQAGNGSYFSISSPEGVASGTGVVSDTVAQPLGDTGLFIKFSSTSSNQPDWIINIPNKTASNYLSNYNAYQMALQTASQVNSQSETSLLNIKAKELIVHQRENALLDAKQALSDYSVTAPFSGIIASVPVQDGQLVTSSTVLASLITEKQFAEISLNEVDVAKIKLGEKSMLTFDAVSGLTISGKVAEIDSVGTVSQGVVTYNVKISFDTQDKRVKPAMSVSANIITDVKQDVLMVSNSSVKSDRNGNYVEMFDVPLLPSTDGLVGAISKIPPNKISVEVGLSNDSQTEIISGIKEGDEVVTRTILPSTTTTTSAPSIFGSPSRGGGGGGNAVRLPAGR
ncbi:MAG: biotin/lipoyl-binding protein [Patescibacteria group bacterium]